MTKRLDALRALMAAQHVEVAIVSKPENCLYFSGFSGTAGTLLITRDSALLVTDFRYMEQAGREAPHFSIVQHTTGLFDKLAELMRADGAQKIGFEGDSLTYQVFSTLAKSLDGCQLKSLALDPLRAVKDAAEIECLRNAVAIADAAFSHILTVLKPGVSELEVAAELEYHMRKLGAEGPAFDTIVASGKRGSLPHGLPSEKRLQSGELVTMDFGAVYRGYHSDITRTVAIGKADDDQRRVYNTVLRAQELGVRATRAGKSGKKIDEEVRKYIVDAGYGAYFGHGLGHGVGLAIHELPRLSPMSTCEKLEPNMLVTVEPGIYLPDWGGIRIEDTVLVTDGEAEILTKSGKQLIEIG